MLKDRVAGLEGRKYMATQVLEVWMLSARKYDRSRERRALKIIFTQKDTYSLPVRDLKKS